MTSNQNSLDLHDRQKAGPVECLGMTFESDEARRQYFLDILRQKLQDPEFRSIEGFPLGEDEDILALSDPPYYTACPNPFIEDFIKHWTNQKRVGAIRAWLETRRVGKKFKPAMRYPDGRELSKDDFEMIRRYQRKLPHWELSGATYFITFRVHNSAYQNGVVGHPSQPADDVVGQPFQAAPPDADEPFQATPPNPPPNADIIEQALWFHHNHRYVIDGYVIMPDHVHLLIKPLPGWSLAGILQGIKGYTARQINERLGRTGHFWQKESFDHLIRNEADWMDKLSYIHHNPVKSGLVERPEDYPYSSLVTIHAEGRLESLPYNTSFYTGDDDYHREPFAADVSEGKNDPIYNAHSYHTKVPHKAIMRYILHYTEPGDVIFDGFCGTGMTGVAAQLCGDKATVESLGYKVRRDGTVLDENDQPFSKIGPRPTVLNDLSPAATFIAYNYNTPVDVQQFEAEAKRILEQVEQECGWVYLTLHHAPEEVLQQVTAALRDDPTLLQKDPSLGHYRGRINYTVWSDVFVCRQCAGELVFWEQAVDQEAGKVRSEFPCPHCNVQLTKRSLDRAWETRYDRALGESIRQARQVPVLINYSVGRQRHEKKPDRYDLALMETIEQSDIPYWFPTDRMPEGDESRRNDKIGITHMHHFYSKRNLWVLGAIGHRCRKMPQLLLLFNSQLINISRLNRYRPAVSFPYNPLSGTLYVGSQVSEADPITAYSNRIKRMLQAYREVKSRNFVECRSSTSSEQMTDHCDYIFTDPPFGGNLMYSELNFLWEAWLKVFTNNEPEAIENKVQGKGLLEYQQIMTRCFEEYYRVLKPGRWMTVVFHNSKNSVWNAIQEALQRAGFVVAHVAILDKQQGSFKQVTSASAVKQDLVISAYKPNGGLEERFKLEAGTEKGVWDFTRTHLEKLPVFVQKDGQSEVIAERQDFLLFDRMVAFHVQRGVTVPLSAAEFYAGLRQRFPERDGMFFLPEQAGEYDRKRTGVQEVLQLQLFVTDESSAIQWVRQQLTRKPQTFQDLQPQYMQEVKTWQKHEVQMELSDILEENFLRYDAEGEVPGPIHAYLSSNYHALRNLDKTDPALVERAKHRWYVPDPNREADLEKIRLRALMREFEQYRESKGRLRLVRTEALRAGFKRCWDEGDYGTIVELAERIPEKLVQEDPALLMYYDVALLRTEG